VEPKVTALKSDLRKWPAWETVRALTWVAIRLQRKRRVVAAADNPKASKKKKIKVHHLYCQLRAYCSIYGDMATLRDLGSAPVTA